MKYTIHLQPVLEARSVHALTRHLNIIKYLRQKQLKATLHPEKRMIKFESSNPGVITHLKKQFGDNIVAILSDAAGKGQYKRPSKHVTPAGIVHCQRRNKEADLKSLEVIAPVAVPLTPMQVAKAYNFPPVGKGISNKVVAIIELGGGFNAKDVLTYCQEMRLAMPRLYFHNVDGSSNIPDGPDGADGEVSLDIDVVAAVAQGAKILVVFAPNTSNGFIDAIAGLSTYFLKPDAVSISWGMPESDWDAPTMQAMNNALHACQQQGINVFVAAGDDGSSDGLSSGKHVDFPSSSPYAISCGGTKLVLNKDGSRNSEVVWNEMTIGEGATGGGVSITGRQVPDLAGNADPQSGFIVNVDGTISSIGGTSAVAPLFAGLTAILASHTSVPILLPVLHANTGIFFDVVSGNNGSYRATPGYDMCSGLGVPDGTKLLNVLQPTLMNKLMTFLQQPIGDVLRNINQK